MAEFPDDVMIAAREAAAKAWAEAGEDMQREFRSGMRDDSGSVQSAAEAIVAERQRGADVVLYFPTSVTLTDDEATETGLLARPAGRSDYVSAILNGGGVAGRR